MNNVEELLKLLIPAFFLVLWALNQLLNKDTNAPGAPGRAGAAPVARPGGLPPAPRPMERAREAPAPSRPASKPTAGPGRDNDIIILPPDNVRPSKGRRAGRSRSGADGQPAGTAQPFGSAERGAANRPLVETAASGSPSSSPPSLPLGTLHIGVPSPLTSNQIRSTLGSIDRIREAFVLSELLSPPVSRRSRRRL